jgi:hypothetical protein
MSHLTEKLKCHKWIILKNVTNMSETQSEWKTIRIRASSYYKLNELSGFLSIILGQQVSLSEAAELTIDTYYNQNHTIMLETISNPELLEQTRTEFKGRMDRLVKLFEPLRKVEKSGT